MFLIQSSLETVVLTWGTSAEQEKEHRRGLLGTVSSAQAIQEEIYSRSERFGQQSGIGAGAEDNLGMLQR